MGQVQALKVLVVEARFYDDLSAELLKGATEALTARGIDYDVITVPGAFEIPGVIAMASEAGRSASGIAYDGYVALGVVIRGETTHYDYVCGESARGLMELAIRERLCIGYGILTTENEAQAWARAKVGEADKGAFAVNACLTMIETKKKLNGKR